MLSKTFQTVRDKWNKKFGKKVADKEQVNCQTNAIVPEPFYTEELEQTLKSIRQQAYSFRQYPDETLIHCFPEFISRAEELNAEVCARHLAHYQHSPDGLKSNIWYLFADGKLAFDKGKEEPEIFFEALWKEPQTYFTFPKTKEENGTSINYAILSEGEAVSLRNDMIDLYNTIVAPESKLKHQYPHWWWISRQ